jgi:heptosyltransferase-3
MKIFFKRIERLLRDLIASFLGVLAHPEKRTAQEIRRAFETGQVEKVLLVRTYQGLGDLLCATPVISNLKSDFPKISLHFLANTFNQAALEGNPKIDRIWAWDERRALNPLGWVRLLRGLRKERFDAAIILSGNSLSLTAMLLGCFSGARWVVGYETRGYGKSWGRRLYSCELPYRAPIREIDKFLGLLSELGLSSTQRSPEYFVSPSNSAFAKGFLQKTFPRGGRPLVGLFLGGKTDRPERIWPPESYAQVARRLVETTGCELLVITPPRADRSRHRRESTFWMDEEVHERGFYQAYGASCPAFREPQLGRVAALIKELDLLICPDGGIMHLAAGIGAPTLALFLGTDPEIWHPPVSSSHYLRTTGADPRSLRPENVIQEAQRLLDVSFPRQRESSPRPPLHRRESPRG